MAIGDLAERFERHEDLTVTNIHGRPLYIDKEQRACPTTTGIIDRLESEGKIRPPLYPTDGISRTTDRPGVVRWYARLVGEGVHERIAGKDDDDYEADIDGIRKQITECEGVGVDHDTVRNTIYN
jgi:hypothetical protein